MIVIIGCYCLKFYIAKSSTAAPWLCSKGDLAAAEPLASKKRSKVVKYLHAGPGIPVVNQHEFRLNLYYEHNLYCP